MPNTRKRLQVSIPRTFASCPGLIIYERLLNALLGKENEQGVRNFDRSDIKQSEELLIPPAYREEVFGFIQNAVCGKEDIGCKVTGEGVIAVTNWHLLSRS